ncbi:glucosidase [Rhodopila globiformis]|uniref:Glucosidase n=2 Tax=Rhodopila globiformis TaxID=1071 RepID=A0A2S6MVE1_RHOGL|nr:glucosidase [Rhodopila globiformis]
MNDATASTGDAHANSPEHARLAEDAGKERGWRRWGPYVSERQWGTVREDYSADGDAWAHLTHDMARSRAYRWGEDGIGGVCDRDQRLCLALALWNGRDPFLKERLFGLANAEGNHGEDVKELYWYLDSTPTHSYLRMLYKYPQAAFPYAQLVEENRRRGLAEPEFEIVDTGVFDDGRYFDVVIEYAKAGKADLLMRVTAYNRGPEAADLHLLPQLWFRNVWSWNPQTERPGLCIADDGAIAVRHAKLPPHRLYCDGSPRLLFCDNDTNAARLYGAPAQGYPKDAFHDHVAGGRDDAVNPAQTGTKAAAHYCARVPPGGALCLRLRLAPDAHPAPFDDFEAVFATRRDEADRFYAVVQAGVADADARLVQRQAYAGLLWSKQFYYFDVGEWLDGDPGQPPPPRERRRGRNHEWRHLNNADIISMPDKWEYPWYAAWDLGFHCVALAHVDPDFAKRQLLLLGRVWYLHPNGQLPAYEWNFSDVNPPIHAWATWRVYEIDRQANGGRGDLGFLERVCHKLMLNFTWWVNRKDADGRNIFQGGFLGLDNIGVFDRSRPVPGGGSVGQSDATAWMAMYSLNLMRIALELSLYNPAYQDIATKFFEHFLHIAEAMTNMGESGAGLWDAEDQFFYDMLSPCNGPPTPLKIRSMVGLIPLFAVEILEPDLLEKLPDFALRLGWLSKYVPRLAALVSHGDTPGVGRRRLLALLRPEPLKAVLRRMLDESEFLSDHGVRALSRVHFAQPYTFRQDGQDLTVRYVPAESDSRMFGGNSNWRGPVWMPVNFLIIESLRRFHDYYGDSEMVECPTGSGRFLTLDRVAEELALRLARIFRRGLDGRRPLFGDAGGLLGDPYFADDPLFFEYFDGDTGRGVGASHQTGWTGLIAVLLSSVSASSNPHETESQ